MKMKKIIGLTGMPGAGKSIIARVAKKIGIPVVVMGDVIREEAARRGLAATPENLGKLMITLRKTNGPGVVARKCFPKIDSLGRNTVLVDGVRSLAEIEEFKKKYGKVVILAVHASPQTRFKRLKARGRPDDPKDWGTFMERDLRELKVGIGSVIALADYILINEGSKRELEVNAEKILKRLVENDQGNR